MPLAARGIVPKAHLCRAQRATGAATQSVHGRSPCKMWHKMWHISEVWHVSCHTTVTCAEPDEVFSFLINHVRHTRIFLFFDRSLDRRFLFDNLLFDGKRNLRSCSSTYFVVSPPWQPTKMAALSAPGLVKNYCVTGSARSAPFHKMEHGLRSVPGARRG